MSARFQVVISAFSIPSCAFIAAQRAATGNYVWAVFWLALGGVHVWLLIDTLREMRAKKGGTNA